MPKVFFTSDQHFNHLNVIKYDQRPYHNLQEMEQELISQWNSVVRDQDTVWFLGDLYLGNKYDYISKIVQQLNGHKHMIRGNHDRLSDKDYLEMGFESISNFPIILKHHFILSHVPFIDFEKDPNHYYIYGHVHNHSDFKNSTCNSTCVSCCRWDYKPIEIPAYNNYKDNNIIK